MATFQVYGFDPVRGGTYLIYQANGNSLQAVVEDALQAGVSMAYAQLPGISLPSLKGAGANFMFADLTEAYFENADLSGAILIGTTATGMMASGAIFARANMSSINLTDANLTRADVRGATVDNIVVTNAVIDELKVDSETAAAFGL